MAKDDNFLNYKCYGWGWIEVPMQLMHYIMTNTGPIAYKLKNGHYFLTFTTTISQSSVLSGFSLIW
jgi:hypothetical protein